MALPWTIDDVEKHKKGLSEKQKKQWVEVANSALQKCLDDGGTDEDCAPKAIRQANGVVKTNENYVVNVSPDNRYTILRKQHQGKTHIVVPVVMMKTGVHNGSHGPILHRIEELGKIVEAWNGIPVTIDHPVSNGTPISANSPEVIDERTVGRVYNSFVDGEALKAECWLDETRLKEISPEAYKYICDKWPLDVSVGVFSEDLAESGTWNGEDYSAIATNHRPDHLALLPGSVGACSWADGCGVRINVEGGQRDVTVQEALKELAVNGFSAYKTTISHDNIREQIHNAKAGAVGKDSWLSVQEVFDDFFVYQVVDFTPDGPSKEALYRQDYSVDKDGKVEVKGDPALVRRKVDYVSMGLVRGKGGKEKMNAEKVNLLIQSEASPFVEANRAFLEALEETQLDQFVEKFKETKVEPVVVPVVHAEEAPKTLDQFLNGLPEAVRDQVKSGLKLHEDKRAELVAKIKGYEANVFTDEELGKKEMLELEKLAKMIPVKANYAPLGAHGLVQANQDLTVNGILPPCGVEVK